MAVRNRIVTLMALVLVALPAAVMAQRRAQPAQLDQMQQFITLMQQYLSVSAQWIEFVSSRERAVYLAIEGITELYEMQGDKAKAIPHLRRILEKYRNNPVIRRAIRFKIRDIYKETGQLDKAMQELEAILAEASR